MSAPAVIRNPAATTTGASVALVLAWLWNDILAVRYKWPAMPEAVVVVLSVFVVDVAREWMSRRAPVPAVAPARPVGRRSPAKAAPKPAKADRRLVSHVEPSTHTLKVRVDDLPTPSVFSPTLHPTQP
jgi:hypothetical protein